VLTAIRLRTIMDALGYAAEANAARHLKPPAEMARLFADHPEALANSLAVLEATGFSLDQLRYEYPYEVLEPGRSPQETLARAVQRCAVAGVSLRCHRSGENGAGRPMAGFPDRQTSDS
jgi:error-prone DNA polymerase